MLCSAGSRPDGAALPAATELLPARDNCRSTPTRSVQANKAVAAAAATMPSPQNGPRSLRVKMLREKKAKERARREGEAARKQSELEAAKDLIGQPRPRRPFTEAEKQAQMQAWRVVRASEPRRGRPARPGPADIQRGSGLVATVTSGRGELHNVRNWQQTLRMESSTSSSSSPE